MISYLAIIRGVIFEAHLVFLCIKCLPGKRGLGLGGDFQWERDVTAQPNWAQASRLLDLKHAQVNLGLRDLLGFLCKTMIEYWFLKEMECPYSMARWKGGDRNKIMCVQPPYVRDPCDVYV